jgi:hypothetical protein
LSKVSDYLERSAGIMVRNSNYRSYLLLIILIAFLLRIWGVDFGLPHIYHTDEWNEVKRALKLGAGIFDFDRVGKGGYFYLLFLEYGVYFVIMKIIGLVKSADDFLFSFFQDPTNIWMIGRITTVMIGTLNCFFVYLLGKNAFSRGAGLFAAALLAVHPLHIRNSHFITVDVPLTILITICFLIMYSKPENFRLETNRYLLLGLFAALAMMTKITAGPVLFSILVFHYISVRSDSKWVGFRSYFLDKRLLFFILVFSIVYLVGDPGILFNYKRIGHYFLSFFQFSGKAVKSGKSLEWPIDPVKYSPALYYLKALFPLKHILLSLLFIAGFVFAFRANFSRNMIFITFVFSYTFFLIASKKPELLFSRYLLPILPILCVYVGIAIDTIWSALRDKRMYTRVLAIAVVALLFFPLIRDAIAVSKGFMRTDNRTIAKNWVEENIPSEAVIYIEGGVIATSAMTVPLKINPEQIDVVFSKYLPEELENPEKSRFYEIKRRALETEKTYNLILLDNEKWLSDALDEKIGDYVILTGHIKSLFSHELNRKHFPEMYRLIRWVDSRDYSLIKVFEKSGRVAGPEILIYKRNE